MASTEVILLVFIILGFLIPIGTISLSFALREPNRKEFAKYTAYECGELPKGEGRTIGFQYYQFVLLFLIFEVSAVLLFIWGFMTSKNNLYLPFLAFLALLVFAIFYATKESDLYIA